MIAEYFILGVKANLPIQLSVYLMIFGAAVAASNDLSFHLLGYIYITINNLSTAANGVYMKKKLDSKDLGMYDNDICAPLLQAVGYRVLRVCELILTMAAKVYY